MGVGGGLVLVTVHAVLADHHGEFRTVALAEENVAASIAYLALIGALSVAAALQLGWRAALLASWSSRSWPGAAAGGSRLTRRTHHLSWGRLPAVFWIAAAMLFCTTAAEWCVTAWGATFVADAADVSTDTAVALMAG